MFEAKMHEALVFKKIIEAIKDLVTDVNIDTFWNQSASNGLESRGPSFPHSGLDGIRRIQS